VKQWKLDRPFHDIDQILVEMGPVDAGAGTDGAQQPADGATAEPGAPKRLYRIREGAMLCGICAGLAAYFRIDVNLVRLLFVIAAFATSGAAIVAYLVMFGLVPEASTSEQHAAAYGLPFNARELVDQAKKKADFASRNFRRQWRLRHRQLKREWRIAMDAEPRWRADQIPGAMFAGIMTPIFGVINAAFFVLLGWVIYSLATNGGVNGWNIPPDMPLWVAIMIRKDELVLRTGRVSRASDMPHSASVTPFSQSRLSEQRMRASAP
jgi:phage shock protein PspC (stress-responsive transcriptional regulator)